MVEAAGVPLGNVTGGAGETDEIAPLDVSIVSSVILEKNGY